MRLEKNKLRIEVLEKLESLDEAQKQSLSEQVISNIDSLFKSKNFYPRHLGVYSPVKGEVNCLMLTTQAKLCFPLFDEHSETMCFKECDKNDLEVIQAFGKEFKVPKLSAPEIIPEVILIPGVAFDCSGARLGRGKGYYDRYLNNIESTLKRRIVKIGICFDQQLLEKVHSEDHDQHMDFVITNKQVIEVNQ